MTANGSSGSILERLIGRERLKRLKDFATRAPVSGKYTREMARKLKPKSDFPVVVIGSGIGGLSAAAHLARSGFEVTVIEQGDKPGGYATSFRRGDFDFEVSLHGAPFKDNPQQRILEELGVLDHVTFERLPEFHRIITPAHDVTFPHANTEKYKDILIEKFPEEAKGIRSFVDEIVGVSNDVDRLSRNEGHFIRLLFPLQYRKLWAVRRKTLEDLLDEHVSNRELRSLLSAIWPYYGLPPSRLSAFYFSVATGNYLSNGGHYPRGRSQDISNAFVKIIEESGGKICLETRVDEILVKNGAAVGVVDERGREYDARAVVSNASAPTTMLELLPEGALTNGFAEKLRTYRPSLSSFVVWLGLDEDITDRIPQAETFITTSHDPEMDYAHCLNADAEKAFMAVTVYDNIFDGYSPPGKST
ncbi:MAG: NAD(P)/FAD-dependent oxidoreductase, partial [Deltaproteobacteria bacterium]|nr:NAD(P)/FAD-dependent oxidoreductase [Deltaproteobacteria bacterium]